MTSDRQALKRYLLENGGFALHTACEIPGQPNGYKTVASRGFNMNYRPTDVGDTRFVTTTEYCYDEDFVCGLMNKPEPDEIVIYIPLARKIKIGEKPVFAGYRRKCLFGKEAVFRNQDVFTDTLVPAREIVAKGSQDVAGNLVYQVSRREPDQFGRPRACIAVGVVSDINAIGDVMNSIEEDPRFARELFWQTFPEWFGGKNSRFHPKTNGKLHMIVSKVSQDVNPQSQYFEAPSFTNHQALRYNMAGTALV